MKWVSKGGKLGNGKWSYNTDKTQWCGRCRHEYESFKNNWKEIKNSAARWNMKGIHDRYGHSNTGVGGIIVSATAAETGKRMFLFGREGRGWAHFHGYRDPSDKNTLMTAIREGAEETSYSIGTPREIFYRYFAMIPEADLSQSVKFFSTNSQGRESQVDRHAIVKNLHPGKRIRIRENDGRKRYLRVGRKGKHNDVQIKYEDNNHTRWIANSELAKKLIPNGDSRNFPFVAEKPNMAYQIDMGILTKGERQHIVDRHARFKNGGYIRPLKRCEKEMNYLRWVSGEDFLRALRNHGRGNLRVPELGQGEWREFTTIAFRNLYNHNALWKRTIRGY